MDSHSMHENEREVSVPMAFLMLLRWGSETEPKRDIDDDVVFSTNFV